MRIRRNKPAELKGKKFGNTIEDYLDIMEIASMITKMQQKKIAKNMQSTINNQKKTMGYLNELKKTMNEADKHIKAIRKNIDSFAKSSNVYDANDLEVL